MAFLVMHFPPNRFCSRIYPLQKAFACCPDGCEDGVRHNYLTILILLFRVRILRRVGIKA
jgi:hypothetical protein